MSWLFWYFPLSSHLYLFQCECKYFLSWFCCTHVVFSYIPLYLPIVTFPLASSFLSILFPLSSKFLIFAHFPYFLYLCHVSQTCLMSYVVLCPCPGHVYSGPRIEWNLESSFVFFLHLTRLPGGVLSQAVSFCRLPHFVFHWRSLNVCWTICLSLVFFLFTGTPFIGRFNRFSSDDSSRASPCLPFLPALCSPCCHFLARFSHCCHF